MSNLSNKELIEMSITQLDKLLILETVTDYPKTLKVIASMLNQRADHIEHNLQTGEQVYKF